MPGTAQNPNSARRNASSAFRSTIPSREVLHEKVSWMGLTRLARGDARGLPHHDAIAFHNLADASRQHAGGEALFDVQGDAATHGLERKIFVLPLRRIEEVTAAVSLTNDLQRIAGHDSFLRALVDDDHVVL